MIAIPASPRIDALVQRPQRHQIELGVFTLDDRVPCDHSVREAEAVIMGLDLTSLDARIRANAEAGAARRWTRAPMLTFWMYCTTHGVQGDTQVFAPVPRQCMRRPWC